jgi:hypothetical protein
MARFNVAEVPNWVRRQERTLDVIVRTSAQRLASVAQLQGPSVARGGGKGGRMPIDQGFLRNTFAANIGSMPTGPSREFEGAGDYEPALNLTIARTEPGDILFMGWTAVYARAMEEKYGFMKGAALQWRTIVNDVTREARSRGL